MWFYLFGDFIVQNRYITDTSTLLILVWGTRFSMLDWALDAGLSYTKGVWYIYDWDTG